MPRIKDIWKLIDKTKVNKRYGLYLSDVMNIIKRSGGYSMMVDNAFRLGYAQGQKAERADARRKERET